MARGARRNQERGSDELGDRGLGEMKVIVDSGANIGAAPESISSQLAGVMSDKIEIGTMTGSNTISQSAVLPGVRSGAREVVLTQGLHNEIIVTQGGLVDAYDLRFEGDAREIRFYPRESEDRVVLVAPRCEGDQLWACTLADIQQLETILHEHRRRLLLGRSWTKEQRRRFARIDAIHNLNHPRDAVLVQMLTKGVYAHLGFGSTDVTEYREYMGPCTGCDAGKVRVREAGPSSTTPASHPGQVWHCDIVELSDGTAYLGALDEHSHLGLWLRLLLGKRKISLHDGYSRLLSFSNRAGHKVREVISDSEETFKEAAAYLESRGVYTGFTPPYCHEKRWERRKQVLNDRKQALEASLNFHVPRKGPVTEGDLYKWVTTLLWFEPTTETEGRTPYEIFFGRGNPLLAFPGGVPLSFGTLVQTVEAHGPELGLVVDLDMTSVGAYRIRFPMWKGTEVTTLTRKATRVTELKGNVPETWGLLRRQPAAKAIREVLTTDDLPSDSMVGGEDREDESDGHLNAELNPIRTPSSPLGRETADSGVPSAHTTVPIAGAEGAATDTSTDAPNVDASSAAAVDEPPIVLRRPAQSGESLEASPDLASSVMGGSLYDSSSGGAEEVRRALPPRAAKAQNWRNGPANDRAGDRSYREYFQVVFDRKTHQRAKKQLRYSEYTRRYPERGAASARAEIVNWVDHGVASAVDVSKLTEQEKKEILSTLAFTLDKMLHGVYDKTKTRLCINGSEQLDDLLGQIYSPTTESTTIFVLLTLLAMMKGTAVVYDIGGAFLHAAIPPEEPRRHVRLARDLAEQWCQVVPEARKLRCKDGSLVLQLHKYAYGLKEAPRKFYEMLVKGLTERAEFKVTVSDRCLLVKRKGEDAVLVSLHVDDELGIIIGDKHNDELLTALQEIFPGEVTSRPANSYLGMMFEHDKEGREVRVSQKAYWEQALEKYGLTGLRVATSPAADDLFEDSTKTEPVCAKTYQSMVMTAQYGAAFTRPDLRLAVAWLATKCQAPTEGDMEKLLRVYAYVKGTLDLPLVLKPKDLQLTMYADASFAVHKDMKSHSGIVIMLGGAPIFVKSTKIKSVKISSTGAETAALCEGCTYLLWIQGLLTELGYPPDVPMVVYQDNHSAIAQSGDECTFRRSKQDLIQMAFVRELVADKVIKVVYCPTEEMVADLLTKPLQGALFRKLRAKLMGA